MPVLSDQLIISRVLWESDRIGIDDYTNKELFTRHQKTVYDFLDEHEYTPFTLRFFGITTNYADAIYSMAVVKRITTLLLFQDPGQCPLGDVVPWEVLEDLWKKRQIAPDIPDWQELSLLYRVSLPSGKVFEPKRKTFSRTFDEQHIDMFVRVI